MSDRPTEKPGPTALPRSPELMNPNETGLLVVDAQDKLLAVIPRRAEVVWNTRRLLDAAATLGVATAATEQYPEKLGSTAQELRERVGAWGSALSGANLMQKVKDALDPKNIFSPGRFFPQKGAPLRS